MTDGKHTGTGGGNHVTIGAMTPSDSPLLEIQDYSKFNNFLATPSRVIIPF